MALKILYLYTEVMGYQSPVFQRLVSAYGASIEVVHWDKNKLTPYKNLNMAGVNFHPRSSFSAERLNQFVLQLDPDLVYISGWQDKSYLKAARLLKAMGCPVVVGFDDQWHGGLRQLIGSLLMKLVWKKKYFSHAWVAGPLQYEYAKKMGFSSNEIIYNLLSCDVAAFSRLPGESGSVNATSNFLFVGRFHPNKGLNTLLEAFEIYKNHLNGHWGLICAGNGPLRGTLEEAKGVQVEEFQDIAGLRRLAESCGAFILPSQREPWGVVVQEFALAGMPLILSDRVGSHPVFLISGYNGYLFTHDSALELAERMLAISGMTPAELRSFSRRSHEMGLLINPEKSAASLMSILGASERGGI
jgi:glycosyltransferase involved in cell wall biosynthesis